MSVTNGQAVSAEVTNPAFMSQKVDTQTVGKVSLNKPTGSGALIVDVQKVMNNFIAVIGMLTQDDTAPAYGTPYVADGSSLKDAITQLGDGLGVVAASFAAIFSSSNTWTGSQTFAAGISYDAQNDAASTGPDAILPLVLKTVIRVTGAGLESIAGITPPDPVTSRILILQNSTGDAVVLKHLSGAAAAGEQIVSPTNGDLTLTPGASIFLFYDQVENQWGVLAGAGGGGGGSGGAGALNWNAPEGVGALLLEENGVKVYSFEDGGGQKITALVQVPDGYNAGNQPFLRVVSYANDVDYHAFEVTTTLLKATLSTTGDTTDQHVASLDLGGVAVPNIFRDGTVELSDVNGQVNGVDVLPGDYLKIEVERTAPVLTPASTNDVKVLFGSMGVSF